MIELLVVIAIIAILAALLMPALENARVQARLIRCTSNEHQAYLGLRMYADEYTDHFMYTATAHYYQVCSWVTDEPTNWGLLLTGDYLSANILQCPGMDPVDGTQQNRYDNNWNRIFADNWQTNGNAFCDYTRGWPGMHKPSDPIDPNDVITWEEHRRETGWWDRWLGPWNTLPYPQNLGHHRGMTALFACLYSAGSYPSARCEVHADQGMNMVYLNGNVKTLKRWKERDYGYYSPRNDRPSWGFWGYWEKYKRE